MSVKCFQTVSGVRVYLPPTEMLPLSLTMQVRGILLFGTLEYRDLPNGCPCRTFISRDIITFYRWTLFGHNVAQKSTKCCKWPLWPISSKSSEHVHSQTIRARKLNCLENVHSTPCVKCHVSHVTYHMSYFMCHISQFV